MGECYGGLAEAGTPAWREHAADERAPAWANAQREGIGKLRELIHWWIDERQLPDGSYGGGWGDDVEMWRWWAPLLLGFEDAKVNDAKERLVRAVLSQPHLAQGYSDKMSDVEHSAEDTGDTLVPMMHLEPEAAEWVDRTLRIVELAEEVWMGENERGGLKFKSTYFTPTEVDLEPKRACDALYHPRVLHPALVQWLRAGDERTEYLVTNWLDTWVDVTAREENGKPAGVLRRRFSTSAR